MRECSGSGVLLSSLLGSVQVSGCGEVAGSGLSSQALVCLCPGRPPHARGGGGRLLLLQGRSCAWRTTPGGVALILQLTLKLHLVPRSRGLFRSSHSVAPLTCWVSPLVTSIPLTSGLGGQLFCLSHTRFSSSGAFQSLLVTRFPVFPADRNVNTAAFVSL